MKRDPNDDSAVWIAYLAGLILIVMLGFWGIKVMQERQVKCEARNGHYYFDRSGGICLAKDAVIKP